MENEELNFLPKPKFKINEIKSYKTNEKPLFYTNLFKVTLTHSIDIYQYPFQIMKILKNIKKIQKKTTTIQKKTSTMKTQMKIII